MVINYNNEAHPGVIIDAEGNIVKVNCVHRNGINRFHWPRLHEDLCLYNCWQVISLIPDSQSLSKQPVQSVCICGPTTAELSLVSERVLSLQLNVIPSLCSFTLESHINGSFWASLFSGYLQVEWVEPVCSTGNFPPT